jgi:hypothetical protein
MILGEGWGRDYAHILMAVRIYRISFFTFLPPEGVKEILMGLEYDAEGERIADLDLYRGREKISWGGLLSKKGPLQDRTALGRAFREKLSSRLPGDKAALLESMEREIKSRRGSPPAAGK